MLLTCGLLAPTAADAAIGFRGVASADNGTGSTTLTINKPSGVVSGDVMLAGISDTYGASTITAPSGWTLVRTLTDSYRTSIYRKTAGASEPADYTWTIADIRRAAGGIVAFSGVDTTTPIQVEDGAVEGATATTSHATPSITTSGSSAWLVSIFSDRRDSGTFSTWSAPSGTTERLDVHSTHGSLSNVSLAIYTVGPVSSGSKTHTATASGSSDKACMEIIALQAAASPPAAPSSLAATTASDSQINLTWTDNASDETGFKIERKTGAGGTYSQIATTGANTTSFNNTGLASGTTYYYRVRAYNDAGDSAYSNEANATTTSSGTIAYRAASSGNNGSGSTTLTIGKPSGVVSGDVMIAGISDTYGQSAITAPSGWTLVRTLTDAYRTSIYRKTAGASEPADYTWTIADIRRAAGGIVAFSGVDTAAPIQVENGAVEGTSATTSHSTPAISTSGSSTWLVSIFSDRRDAGAFSTWTPPSGTSERLDVHSTNSSMTNVSVAIFTAGPVSAGSAAHTATASGSSDKACMEIIALQVQPAGTAPAAPSSLVAAAASNTQINLTWADNATNETGFKIERKTGSGGTYSQIATTGANSTSFNNTGLTSGTTYYYRVRAYNGSGDSAYTNEADATTSTGSGFDCLDDGGGTLNSSFANLGTTTSAAILSSGGSTRYDFRGTVLNNSYNSSDDVYTPSYNVQFGAAHNGGCAFGGTIKHGYAESLGRYESGIRNYPENHGGQIFDKSGGTFYNVTNFTIDGWRMHHNWDPIRFNSGGSGSITLKQCWISDTYDDIIENDEHRDGYYIDDCLIERTFMFISCRNKNNTTNYGSRIMTINNSLIGLDEMYPNASDGRSIGMFFKLDGNSVKFDIYNCIFYTPRSGDHPNDNDDPFNELMEEGKLRNSSGNIIVWGGSGSYPHAVPPGFTVTTDVSVWTNAVAAWKTNHPHVPRISGFDP